MPDISDERRYAKRRLLLFCLAINRTSFIWDPLARLQQLVNELTGTTYYAFNLQQNPLQPKRERAHVEATTVQHVAVGSLNFVRTFALAEPSHRNDSSPERATSSETHWHRAN